MKQASELFLLLIFLIISPGIKAQDVPYHIDNEAVYDFIDELADIGAIDINSAIKPYSRMQIARWLKTAETYTRLTPRQKKAVAFYLKDFNKELITGKDFNKRFDIFYYSDSVFKFSVNGILGGQGFTNGNSFEYHRRGGADFFAYIGKHFGFYGSLRDNHESSPLGGRQYLTKHPGAVYKGDKEETDYSEARGGITFSWEWLNIGLVKDHYTYGNGYSQANILSGHSPSYAHLYLKLNPVKWFEFSYNHGWLVSGVIDSCRSYGYYDGTREVYTNKFIASNLFTFIPWKRLRLSLGNSIVYGDVSLNPVFFIPFIFYKSADHTYNSGSNDVGHNAQMYFDVSSRQIRYLHLYASVFIDEISTSRMFDKDQQSNYVSYKAGARLSGLIPDASFTAEYTRTNPMVYQHIIPSTTYESDGYVLGHYMKDNSDKIYLSVRYKPVRGLDIQVSYTKARRGKDYQKIIEEGDFAANPEINPDEPRWGLPFMNEVRYKKRQWQFRAGYQIINDAYIFLIYENNNITGADKDIYTPPFYLEGDNIFSFGINFGF
ncbi:MAG: capsule assembly Wzi family protein [Chlorobi bacterium]|nr:capsule assembly Wzi family protein [Chlorobiota bacterium]